jgi:hypothetical protein
VDDERTGLAAVAHCLGFASGRVQHSLPLTADGRTCQPAKTLRRIRCDVPLRRPASAGFSLTPMARDQAAGPRRPDARASK